MPRRTSDGVEPPVGRDWSSFPGFSAPTYTQVPDEVFDMVMPFLTGAEIKVLLYIIRRTFGFKKGVDAIGLEQLCHGIVTREGRRLDYGTQLGRTTVGDALRSLREKRVIVARQTVKEDGSPGPTLYALHMAETPAQPLNDPRYQRYDQVAAGGMSEDRHTPVALPTYLSRQGGPPPVALPAPQETGSKKQNSTSPPVSPLGGTTPGRGKRRRRRDEEETGPERYTRGPYGVCPVCNCSPHDPDCPTLQEGEKQG